VSFLAGVRITEERSSRKKDESVLKKVTNPKRGPQEKPGM